MPCRTVSFGLNIIVCAALAALAVSACAPADSYAQPKSGPVGSLPMTRPVDPVEVACCQPLGEWGISGSWFQSAPNAPTSYYLTANARPFYLHDQRIEFTGQESTFAVEAAAYAQLVHRYGDCQLALYTEWFLSQPFDRNILADYPERTSFANNFDVNSFEISQLSVMAEYRSWTLELGRFVTPFGRYWAPVYLNSFADTPFIRSEAIQFRETGAQVRFEPGALRMAAAITNGSRGRDTNSSKALVARVGVDYGWLVAGGSVKTQDGIGSESQKEFNSHAGIDAMVQLGRGWFVSGELIHDEYGLRRPGLALDDIDWGRSLYNRQLNNGLNRPLTGWGGYANLVYAGQAWQGVLGYGQFAPNPIGDPIHDTTTRRFLVQVARRLGSRVDLFGSVIVENPVPNAQGGRKRHGVFILGGVVFRL